MKKSDIAMIVLIATVSVIIAFFVAQSVFSKYKTGSVTVKTIEAVKSEVEAPSKDIFNKDAINPAVEVKIEDTTNKEVDNGTTN